MFSGSSYSSSPYSADLGQAQGYPATSIGQVTRFGNPETYLLATGFAATNFGTPLGAEVFPAESLGKVSIFGTPIADVDQTAEAISFGPTVRFGVWVQSLVGPPPADRSFAVLGFKPVVFGIPTGKANSAGTVTGIYATALGTPMSIRAGGAAGLYSTMLGTPGLRTLCRATGLHSTAFGTPGSSRIGAVTGIYRAARFGLPVAVRSNCYYPYGLYNPARFGQPRTGVAGYSASGLYQTQLGTPESVLKYRALHIPPTAVVGTPTALRTPLC